MSNHHFKRRVVSRSLRCLRHEDGSSALELALVMPLFVLLFVVIVDLGRAYYAAMEVSAAAEAGALYGIQNPFDTSGLLTASRLGAPDLPALAVTSSFGCSCSDGTLQSASCSVAPSCPFNIINYVQVQTSVIYIPWLRYPGLPASFVLRRSVRLRAAH